MSLTEQNPRKRLAAVPTVTPWNTGSDLPQGAA